jgi:hypothetical protein
LTADITGAARKKAKGKSKKAKVKRSDEKGGLIIRPPCCLTLKCLMQDFSSCLIGQMFAFVV